MEEEIGIKNETIENSIRSGANKIRLQVTLEITLP